MKLEELQVGTRVAANVRHFKPGRKTKSDWWVRGTITETKLETGDPKVTGESPHVRILLEADGDDYAPTVTCFDLDTITAI